MIEFAVRALVLDVEGTTSSVSYVYDVLFPFARKNVQAFLSRHWQEAEAMETVKQMARDAGFDSLSSWMSSSAASTVEQQIAVVIKEVERLMDADVKATGLKALQGLIWREGYRAGQLTSHVFPDVPEALAQWSLSGLPVRIYSSGSIEAQKMFFAHTEYGNLSLYVSGHHDTTTGAKSESASYKKIAREMGLPPQDILFLSDAPAELAAARQAGMQVALVARTGNTALGVDAKFPRIEDFREIKVHLQAPS